MSALIPIAIILVKIVVVISVVMSVVAVMSWVERRGSAFIQDRLGPNRVGWFGLMQPVADGLKFLFKEEIIPAQADKALYLLAPLMIFVPALAMFAVIPFGSSLTLGGRTIDLSIGDSSVAILYVLALSGLSVYGLVLAGYASGSKYPLMGGLRSAAQLIAYELPMAMAVFAVLYQAQTLSLSEIAASQSGTFLGFIPRWYVFPQIIGFLVFFTTALAETNRIPFDLPEADSELVVGYHTEYGSMKFAMFMMGEYTHMTAACALIVVLYFGGWQVPYLALSGNFGGLVSMACFCVKVGFFLWVFVWIRWTLPRFRYDQLMRLCWTVLLPLSFANLALTMLLCRWGS
jgi:NADH-quinone oxidoreductase subunit H